MGFDPNFSQGPSQGKKKENPEETRMILTNNSSRIVYVSMILSTQFLLRYFILMKLTTHIILQLCLPRMSRKGNKPILLAVQIPEPFWASSQRSRSPQDFIWYPFYSARVINQVVKTQEIPASSPVARHHFLGDIWGIDCPCSDFAKKAKSRGSTLVARVYKGRYL